MNKKRKYFKFLFILWKIALRGSYCTFIQRGAIIWTIVTQSDLIGVHSFYNIQWRCYIEQKIAAPHQIFFQAPRQMVIVQNSILINFSRRATTWCTSSLYWGYWVFYYWRTTTLCTFIVFASKLSCNALRNNFSWCKIIFLKYVALLF